MFALLPLEAGHFDAELEFSCPMLTCEIVRPKRPAVDTANGTSTRPRSAPAAAKQASGIDRVRQSPGCESLKAEVTSRVAPSRVPHRGSVQRKLIVTLRSGAWSRR